MPTEVKGVLVSFGFILVLEPVVAESTSVLFFGFVLSEIELAQPVKAQSDGNHLTSTLQMCQISLVFSDSNDIYSNLRADLAHCSCVPGFR